MESGELRNLVLKYYIPLTSEDVKYIFVKTISNRILSSGDILI